MTKDCMTCQKAVSPLEQNQPATYRIGYHDGEKLTDVWLPYIVCRTIGCFSIQFSNMKVFAEDEALSERIWNRLTLAQFYSGKTLSKFVAGAIPNAPDLEEESLFAEAHAQWLISLLADLRGKTPRDFLLAKREFVDFDLHSRELQWSFTEECPPPLSASSHAYRFAGFGTHEIVLYYDLIRLLLDECYSRAHEEKHASLDDEIERLEHLKSAWLETPCADNHGKAPALIIEWERKRIPLATGIWTAATWTSGSSFHSSQLARRGKQTNIAGKNSTGNSIGSGKPVKAAGWLMKRPCWLRMCHSSRHPS
jgi:hypothetical protein